MTGNDLRAGLLQQMGRAVLACGGVLDARKIADDLIGADMSAGFLSEDEARRSRTAEQYQSGVMRAFAALAALGTVEDLGDYPPYCAVKAGELLGLPALAQSGRNTSPNGHNSSRPDVDATEDAVVAAVLTLPVRDERPGTLRRGNLDVTRLDAHLARTVSGYRELADDAPGTWQLLADLHDRGLLDVSAAASRYLVTGVRVISPLLPPAFAVTRPARLRGRRRRSGYYGISSTMRPLVPTGNSPTTSGQNCQTGAARTRETGAQRAGTPARGRWETPSRRLRSRWRRRGPGQPGSVLMQRTGNGDWTSRCHASCGRCSAAYTCGTCTARCAGRTLTSSRSAAAGCGCGLGW